MESFTHESEESSSCTQSDADSTNSSNGTNPFLLCPRTNSSSLHLHLGGQSRTHDTADDTRPFKVARREPPLNHQYHVSAITNPVVAGSLQYPHNMVGVIRDGVHSPASLSHSRSYAPSALEDCRISAAQTASSARSQHGNLPYLGPNQSFVMPDQWADLRQQTYVLKHMAACNNPMLLPIGCKVENVPVNYGNNAGSYFVGLADPQPGRCRRTDGKKWRCGRAVVPNQKYCERHMHRGRGRSKAARLAKVSTPPCDSNQPLTSPRPLNPPLIHLLNQLAVPGQPPNQPLDPVQKPPIPAQPLQWLSNPAQPFLHPHGHLPFLAQPLHAEPLNQAAHPSKPPDWPINQTPMEAEPLNIVHAYGVPPNLAQAIPINTVPDIKSAPFPVNGAKIAEAQRPQADDPDDVFTLDVQGIKRLLENAPCSVRFRKLASQQKQLPNLADLLNVAHFKSPTVQPKRPPSLMDVLKMVDPAATSAVPRNTTSAVDNELKGAEEQGRKYSSSTLRISGALDLVVSQQDGGRSPQSFRVKLEEQEGLDQIVAERGKQIKGVAMQTADLAENRGPSTTRAGGDGNDAANISCGKVSSVGGCQSKQSSVLEEIQDCLGSSAISGKPNASLQEGKESPAELSTGALTLIKGQRSKTEEKSPDLGHGGLKVHRQCVELDINSVNPEEDDSDHHNGWKQSQNKIMEVCSKHHVISPELHKSSPESKEKSLDHCKTAVGKPERSLACMPEESKQYDCSSSQDPHHLRSVRKSSVSAESRGGLDMNSPILVEERVEVHGRPGGKLEKNSVGGSESSSIALQTKASLGRSGSEEDSCNANINSKSSPILEPADVNNLEPLLQVSLAVQPDLLVCDCQASFGC